MLEELLRNPGYSLESKLHVAAQIHNNNINIDQAKALLERGYSPKHHDVENSHFGRNIWVRKQYFPNAGEVVQGHKHLHDHITLLVQGAALLYIEGDEPVKLSAPASYEIKANLAHRFVPLEDNTQAWCVWPLCDDEEIKKAEAGMIPSSTAAVD